MPDKLSEEAKTHLKSTYSTSLTEIDNKVANDILVKSSPTEAAVRAKAIAASAGSRPKSLSGKGIPPVLSKYCQFPPTGANSVTVGTKDYECLEDEMFLNDTIINFYLRYLQFKLMSEVDRNRTYVFETFFYGKLTRRPTKLDNKLHPIEDNQNLTAAEKRYERVKRWTRKVNLFEKDFIIIPINEQ